MLAKSMSRCVKTIETYCIYQQYYSHSNNVTKQAESKTLEIIAL